MTLSINRHFLAGELANSIRLQTTQKGTKWTRFRIKTESVVQGKLYFAWHDCVAWAHCAEKLDGLEEGEVVFVEGRGAKRKWIKPDGTEMWTYEITAYDCGPITEEEVQEKQERLKIGRNKTIRKFRQNVEKLEDIPNGLATAKETLRFEENVPF